MYLILENIVIYLGVLWHCGTTTNMYCFTANNMIHYRRCCPVILSLHDRHCYPAILLLCHQGQHGTWSVLVCYSCIVLSGMTWYMIKAMVARLLCYYLLRSYMISDLREPLFYRLQHDTWSALLSCYSAVFFVMKNMIHDRRCYSFYHALHDEYTWIYCHSFEYLDLIHQ